MARNAVIILALTGLASCGGGSGDTADASSGGQDAIASGPGLAGLLIDPAGAPAGNVDVLACQATTCAFGESDSDGRFDFAIEAPAEVALKTHADLTRTPRLAAALEPVAIVDGTLVQVGDLYIPDLPAGAVIAAESEDPQTLAAGDGLELTLSRADLTPPIGEILFDVAARKLAAQHIPPYPDLDGEEVVAVYAMHPFAATSASPMAVRAALDLPDGTQVKLRTISELDGNFSEAVPGQADGGFVTTDPGTGITRITYLVISR